MANKRAKLSDIARGGRRFADRRLVLHQRQGEAVQAFARDLRAARGRRPQV